jgi:hypothetical protein
VEELRCANYEESVAACAAEAEECAVAMDGGGARLSALARTCE